MKEEIFDKELALHFYRKILKRVNLFELVKGEFVRALVENDEKML